MKIRLFSILLVSFISYQLNAQTKTLTSDVDAKLLSKKCAILFKDNKIDLVFKELKPYWPLPENELNSFENKTEQYINLLTGRFGNTETVVKIKEETIKDFAIRETYILKFEKSAIRLIFTFYKNNTGWILNAFKWDDSFTEEFTPL